MTYSYGTIERHYRVKIYGTIEESISETSLASNIILFVMLHASHYEKTLLDVVRDNLRTLSKPCALIPCFSPPKITPIS